MSKQILNGTTYGKPRDIRELTQAQYDALSNAEKMNGVLYCIKDSGPVEGDQYAPIIYSLEEREIGTWVDGKPLYQKTVSFVLTENTGAVMASYPHGIENIDYVCNTESKLNYPRPVNGNSYEYGILGTTTGIEVETGRDRHTQRVYVTLQYTKTTDVPGSGSYGTDGVPMVHYDENEKVIGTWFGETLYERTIYYDNASGITTTLQDDYEIATISNIVLRSAKGTMVNSTNGHSYALPYSVGSKGITIVYKSNSSLCLRSVGDTWGNNWKFYITIQYTKS